MSILLLCLCPQIVCVCNSVCTYLHLHECKSPSMHHRLCISILIVCLVNIKYIVFVQKGLANYHNVFYTASQFPLENKIHFYFLIFIFCI